MSGPDIVTAWPKNAREEVRVSLGEFNGTPTIDLRTWYQSGDGDFRPSNKGLTLAVRHLPQLAEGLTKALAKAREAQLISEG